MYAPAGINPPEGLSDTPGDTPENRGKTTDNTKIAPYLAGLMGLDLQTATNELFVDVTDLGTYNSTNKTFTFNEADISIVANQSVATVDGNEVDLGGEIAVYSNNRFYVPNTLFSQKGDQEATLIVKTARYKDELSGKVLVKGQIDKAFAGTDITILLLKKGVDPTTENAIGYIDQSTINDDGSYVFKFMFDGNVDDYELKMRLGDETVTDSITEATASYSWLDAGVLIVQENDNSISSEVVINNYYDIEGLIYVLALSFYDENNKLIGISISDDVEIIGDKITIDDLNALMPDGTATIKSIVWSSFTQMIPLCNSDIVTVQ